MGVTLARAHSVLIDNMVKSSERQKEGMSFDVLSYAQTVEGLAGTKPLSYHINCDKMPTAYVAEAQET